MREKGELGKAGDVVEAKKIIQLFETTHIIFRIFSFPTFSIRSPQVFREATERKAAET